MNTTTLGSVGRAAASLRPVAMLLSALLLSACGTSPAEGSSEASTSGSESLPEAPRVTGAEARAMVESGALLLDVTPPARAERSMIEGRTHIPVGELDARMGELPRDQDIVVYCFGGGASPRAAARLRAAGYRAFVLGARANWDNAAPTPDAPSAD